MMTADVTSSIQNMKFPLKVRGKVVRGFGRGGKELGIPTANFDEKAVNDIPNEMSAGIYYGYAQVSLGNIYEMVMSIGWNPYYKNEKRSAEVHILHDYPHDFYSEELRVLILGYIRAEKDYISKELLVCDIRNDIEYAHKELQSLKYNVDQENFFKSNEL